MAGVAGEIEASNKASKTYSGKACRHCGNNERYLSNGACAYCARAKARKVYMLFPEKVAARRRGEYQRNADTRRDYKFRATYGISLQEYNQLLSSQGGKCAICRNDCSSGRRLCVDHNHQTGMVRGLLCVNCNRAVGNLRDDPKLLREAANYLEQ